MGGAWGCFLQLLLSLQCLWFLVGPPHLCISSLHGYSVAITHPAGVEPSSYDSHTAVISQLIPIWFGSVSVTGLAAIPTEASR